MYIIFLNYLRCKLMIHLSAHCLKSLTSLGKFHSAGYWKMLGLSYIQPIF